jgi:hypothetical protein
LDHILKMLTRFYQSLVLSRISLLRVMHHFILIWVVLEISS